MSLYEIEEHINAMIREEEPLAENESPELQDNAEKWMKSKAMQHFDSMPPRVAVKKAPVSKAVHPADERRQRTRNATETNGGRVSKAVELRDPTKNPEPRPAPQGVSAKKTPTAKPQPHRNAGDKKPSTPRIEKKAPSQKEQSSYTGKSASAPPSQNVRKVTAGTGSKNTVFAGKKSTEQPPVSPVKKKGLLHRLLGKGK